nr:DNA polymerase III subunit gamma and tau [Brevibacterium yomogidense]
MYRRYRPEAFDEVIGQEHVTRPLSAAIDAGRINHAFLFSGPRGCGKTTSARILARCLNCAEGPTANPCGECPSCRDLANGGPGSLDVVEIDAASHNGVDDARDLRERAVYAPARDRYKVFILDEAHMVTTQGFNALLKLVEEPPAHVKFVFATTEPDKVIGTIRSRTHHYPFRLVPPETLGRYLEDLATREGVPVGKGVLPLVVRAGGGSVRDTLSVLDQLMAGSSDDGIDYKTAVALLGYTDDSLLGDIVDSFSAGDGAGVFRVIDRVVESGHDPRRFVEDLLERFRDLFVISAAEDSAASFLPEVPADRLERLKVQARAFGPAELSRAADLLNAGLTEMTGATSPRLQLELICARILLPGAEDSRRSVVSRVDRLERRVGMAAGGRMPAGAVHADGGAVTQAAGGPAAPVGGEPARTDGGSSEGQPAGRGTGGPSAAPAGGGAPAAGGAEAAGGAAAAAQDADPFAGVADAMASARSVLDGGPGAKSPTNEGTARAPEPAGQAGAGQAGPGQAASRQPAPGQPTPDQQPDAAAGPAAAQQHRGPDGQAPSTPQAPSAPQRRTAPQGQMDQQPPTGRPASAGQSTPAGQQTPVGQHPPADQRPHSGWQPGPGQGPDTAQQRSDAAQQPAPTRDFPGAASTASQGSAQAPQPASPRQPEPASRPSPDVQPEAHGEAHASPEIRQAPGVGAEIDAIRRGWPDVLVRLQQLRKLSYAIVSGNSFPQRFEGGVLYLGFSNPGSVQAFRRGPHAQFVSTAVEDSLGIRAEVRVGDENAGPPPPHPGGPSSGGPASGGPAPSGGSASGGQAPSGGPASGGSAPAGGPRDVTREELDSVVGPREADREPVDHDRFWQTDSPEPGPASSPSSDHRQPPSPRGREHHDDAEDDSRSHLTDTEDSAGSFANSEVSDVASGEPVAEDPWTPSPELDHWSAGAGSVGSDRPSRSDAVSPEPGSSPEYSGHVLSSSEPAPLQSDNVTPVSEHAPPASDDAAPASEHVPQGPDGAAPGSAGDARWSEDVQQQADSGNDGFATSAGENAVDFGAVFVPPPVDIEPYPEDDYGGGYAGDDPYAGSAEHSFPSPAEESFSPRVEDGPPSQQDPSAQMAGPAPMGAPPSPPPGVAASAAGGGDLDFLGAYADVDITFTENPGATQSGTPTADAAEDPAGPLGRYAHLVRRHSGDVKGSGNHVPAPAQEPVPDPVENYTDYDTEGDADIEHNNEFGPAVVERILGGVIIEEIDE